MNSFGNPMVEDESFPFGGYWRGTVCQLITGDGVRFSADRNDPTWFVEHIANRGDGNTSLVLMERSAHVARVAADAFGRPVEGMESDGDLHTRLIPSTTECWVRI